MSIGILGKFSKRTDEVKSYKFDYGDFLADKGDTVSGSPVVTASPSGLTIGTVTVLNNVVLALVSGGTAGVKYTLKCVVTTTGGLEEDASLQVTVTAA